MKAICGHVDGFPESEPIAPAELLALRMRHPGSGGARKHRHAENAGTVGARIVAEAANGPLTPAADRILEEQRRVRHSRHSVQRGRRYRVLLRVGAGRAAPASGRRRISTTAWSR